MVESHWPSAKQHSTQQELTKQELTTCNHRFHASHNAKSNHVSIQSSAIAACPAALAQESNSSSQPLPPSSAPHRVSGSSLGPRPGASVAHPRGLTLRVWGGKDGFFSKQICVSKPRCLIVDCFHISFAMSIVNRCSQTILDTHVSPS